MIVHEARDDDRYHREEACAKERCEDTTGEVDHLHTDSHDAEGNSYQRGDHQVLGEISCRPMTHLEVAPAFLQARPVDRNRDLRSMHGCRCRLGGHLHGLGAPGSGAAVVLLDALLVCDRLTTITDDDRLAGEVRAEAVLANRLWLVVFDLDLHKYLLSRSTLECT